MLPNGFFQQLVLNPCEQVFGEAITVNPIKSQPKAPVYNASAIFSNRPSAMQMMDGSALVYENVLGINLQSFPVQPLQGDQLFFRNQWYDVTSVRLDGQGGAEIQVKLAIKR